MSPYKRPYKRTYKRTSLDVSIHACDGVAEISADIETAVPRPYVTLRIGNHVAIFITRENSDAILKALQSVEWPEPERDLVAAYEETYGCFEVQETENPPQEVRVLD